MPRRPLGSPNKYGASCPECGQVLVFEHFRRPGAHEFVCPRAKLEYGLTGDPHVSLWLWSENDVIRLARGDQTEWHRREREDGLR